jgi:thiamine-phosphate pyrophosphorylase
MRQRFPKLYAIVDRATLDAREIAVREFATELREAGVRLVQYRDKVNGFTNPANRFAGGNGPQEILRAAREIDAAFEGAEVMRIMNDRADLAVLAGWEGVHVGHGDLGVEAARRVLAGVEAGRRADKIQGSLRSGLRPPVEMTDVIGAIVGVSTHSEEQVRAAVEPMSQNRDSSTALRAGFGHPDSLPEYVAVGPVFRTASKANPEPVVGMELVRRARAMTELPIVAIGGITLANARSVLEAGADSVAVIGGLFVEGRRVGEVARDFLDVLG